MHPSLLWFAVLLLYSPRISYASAGLSETLHKDFRFGSHVRKLVLPTSDKGQASFSAPERLRCRLVCRSTGGAELKLTCVLCWALCACWILLPCRQPTSSHPVPATLSWPSDSCSGLISPTATRKRLFTKLGTRRGQQPAGAVSRSALATDTQ